MGLRWGDIVGTKLTISRTVVQIGKAELIVKSTKSGAERAITLDTATLAELAAHGRRLADSAKQEGGTITAQSYVFPDLAKNRNGKTPRRPGWITHAWQQKRPPGSRARLHDLRHWHASALLDSGRSLPEVSERLGHADTAVTARVYAHAVEGADSGSAEVMFDLLALPRAVEFRQ